MKNKLGRTVSTIIAIALLLSSVFNVVVSASNICLEDSFSKLKNTQSYDSYVPPNPVGNCYYTAITMMLMFYDSYWHEDFVADHLEWDAGEYSSTLQILTKAFSAEAELNAYNSYISDDSIENRSPRQFYLDHANEYLQSHLISRGISEGYHPYVEANTYEENNFFSFNVDQCVDFLNSYFAERGLGGGKVTVHYEFGEIDELIPLMESQIDEGFPVLYRGRPITSESEKSDDKATASSSGELSLGIGHIMLAYGVNSDGDILLHSGWNVNHIQNLSTTEYKYDTYIIWLEINMELLPHECANNYVETTALQPLCSCQIYSEHEVHDDNHLFREKNNDTIHYTSCHCGIVLESAPHVLSYECNYSYKHTKKCDECDYEVFEGHSYTTVLPSTSSAGHYKACICGHQSSVLTAHYESQYQQFNDLRHKSYCACGYYIGFSAHTWITSGMFAHCAECGVRVDISDKPILMGTEDDTPHQAE